MKDTPGSLSQVILIIYGKVLTEFEIPVLRKELNFLATPNELIDRR